MHIRRTLLFIPDKEKGRSDAKLRFRIKWDGGIVAFSVGYRVDIDKWSYDTQFCKNNTSHGKKHILASVINREITRFRDVAENVFSTFETSGINPTPELFRKKFNQEIGSQDKKNSDNNILDLFDKYVGYMSRMNEWSSATYKTYNTLRLHIKEFGKTDVQYFNETGMSEYLYFMQSSLKLRNTTIAKRLRQIKGFLTWCVKQGYKDNTYDISEFRPTLKQAEKKVIFLNWDELIRLYNYEIPADFSLVKLTDIEGKPYKKLVEHSKTLERVKDVFCFTCFTSLRYSDVSALKKENIYDGYIELTSKKTVDALRIELNKYSKAILDKYKDFSFPERLAFPIISNPKMNYYIKEACELAGINTPTMQTYYRNKERYDTVLPKYKLVTVHAGRRTFISNALILGIPPHVVMKWTGHKDYKTMRPYIAIADDAKAKAMSLFDKVPDLPK